MLPGTSVREAGVDVPKQQQMIWLLIELSAIDIRYCLLGCRSGRRTSKRPRKLAVCPVDNVVVIDRATGSLSSLMADTNVDESNTNDNVWSYLHPYVPIPERAKMDAETRTKWKTVGEDKCLSDTFAFAATVILYSFSHALSL